MVDWFLPSLTKIALCSVLSQSVEYQKLGDRMLEMPRGTLGAFRPRMSPLLPVISTKYFLIEMNKPTYQTSGIRTRREFEYH